MERLWQGRKVLAIKWPSGAQTRDPPREGEEEEVCEKTEP